MNSKLLVALLALGMLTAIFTVAPTARGLAQVVLEPPQYHPTYYVPGEPLEFTLTILAGDPTVYDILVVWDDGVTRTNWSGNQFDDVSLSGSTLPLTFGILPLSASPAMRDGDWYAVEVHDSQWIDTGGGGPGRVTFDTAPFSIRTWTLALETDRSRYLPGDNVTVSWSANMIRDGSLAPLGDGQLWVRDSVNNALITPNPYVFTTPTGSLVFRLNSLIPTTRTIIASAWYNTTRSNADRFWFDTVAPAPTIDGLRMLVNVVAASYEPGGIVTVDIHAKITDFAPNLFDPGAAGVIVDVTVTDQRTNTVVPAYGTANVSTDTHGTLHHVFQLGMAILDGTPFLVSARGVFQNGPQSTATDTFTVSSRAGMTIVLVFDKSQYLSGDTVRMTVEVSGSTGPFTFISEARDASNNNLLDRQTSASNVYQFAIPRTFDGSITFYATADDGQGNRRTAFQTFLVLLGILVVNLDRVEYDGGDTVTASYALTRNPQVLPNPTYYYEILDTSGVLVRSGVAAQTTVGYQVPAVPATQYTFRITATEAGRSLSGGATASLVSGVLLSIGFDRAGYNPGEPIRISYSLTPRGRTSLPSSFVFFISIAGAPAKTVQTTAPTGELTYTIPGGTNTGQLPVIVTEGNTGAFAVENVTVGPTNALWSDVGGIPAIVVVMGLFLILAYIAIMLMWRRMMPGMAPRAPGEGPPMERPAPHATAQPGPAPMSVTCTACGAPIEITTSRRPIEVMCPSCGETQMVQ
jgi:hypothetical protein